MSGYAPKQITIGELFTDAEIDKAGKLMEGLTLTSLVDAIEEQIIKPAMPRINELTGQENSPRYFAYALYYALTQGNHGR